MTIWSLEVDSVHTLYSTKELVGIGKGKSIQDLQQKESKIDSLFVVVNRFEENQKTVMQNVEALRALIRLGFPKEKKLFAAAENIIAKAKKIDDKEGLAWSKYYLSRSHLSGDSDYSLALPLLLEAISIFEELELNYGSSQCYMQMGLISYMTQYYEDAIKNFKLSLEFAPNPTSSYLMAISLSELDKFTEAKSLFFIAIKEFEKENRVQNISECYMYLGKMYLEEGLLDSSFYYLNTVIQHLKVDVDVDRVARPYALFSEYHFKKGDLDSAEFYALASIDWAKGANDYLSPIIGSSILAEVYDLKKEYKKAHYYLKKLHALRSQDLEGGTKQKIAEMQTIFEFKKKIVEEQLKHEREIQKKNNTRNIMLITGLFLLILALALWSRLQYVRKSKTALQNEKNISENLLLNILPEEIAHELKEKGEAKARDFDMVSILFTDFKDFTLASAKLSAQDLVREINTCFEAFDGIMEKYSIEKIKTIGDAYMAAGGLPIPSADSTKNTVLASLEMQEFISKRKMLLDAKDQQAFEMRVGIHTGPVVAGIVGVKKFQYDIWGDTVNTASRMESSGQIGKVNISKSTHEFLMNDPDFIFEKRGEIDVKGKGLVDMWFVNLSNAK